MRTVVAAAVGLIAPLLRHLMFGMPPFPVAFAMCFELAAYGLISGLLYTKLPKRPLFVYLSLLGAMLSGRIVWGIAMVIIMNVSGGAFTWQAFFAGGFAQAVPGILVQIVLIPPLVLALRKTGIIRE